MSLTRTLGLDLGSNSIGWALVETDPGEKGRIVATGVRIFPEGVDRDTKGTEVSKSEGRRIARGMRRQIARRARRRRNLRRALVQSGLLPQLALAKRDDPVRVAWEKEQHQACSPYDLRVRALQEELSPYELGRIFLHLAQRRGFLSNRKGDRAKKKEASDLLKKISQLAEDMGDDTLGVHLAKQIQADSFSRVRGKHTRRDMLIGEFDRIWEAQAKYHPQLLTEKLKYGEAGRLTYPVAPKGVGKGSLLERFGIFGIIFFQRPMYWPKSVVGQCEQEPKQKRCPRADRRAQRFRLLHEVNNLRILDANQADERPLTAEERDKLLKALGKKKELKFTEMKKQIGLLEGARFNLERGERDKLLGLPTDAALAAKKLFDKRWYDLSEQRKNEIVCSLLEDEEPMIIEKATKEWGVDQKVAEALADLDLPEGYSSYSVVAIEKLLPHMERGLPLMTGDGTPCAMAEAGYLRPDQRTVNQRDTLPPPPNVTNPLVRQALHEVRKLVNAIIREYGKPSHIHIELAREVKGTAKDRAKRTAEMASRRRERDKAADRLRVNGHKVTQDAIDRFLLWEEQNHECIYSGKPISLAQLLGGEVHVDHVLPYSRCLDNSLMNRVVCFRDENDLKGDKTPHEWLAATQPQKFDEVLQRSAKLPYGKARKFRVAELALDDFIARQLVDTAYISRQVVEYVKCLGCDVVCSKGQNTAELRHHWGLDTVLRDDGFNLKNREDHRHHAVDAIVIALTDRKRLHHLSRIRRRGGTDHTGEVLPDPWPTFRETVEKAVNAINVSHRVQRKVRGALHEEKIYGATQKRAQVQPKSSRPWAKNWIEEQDQFVYRKRLEELTLPMIDDIRDPTIKQLVWDRLKQFGLEPGKKGSIPEEAWREPLRMPSGTPVKKVRLLKQDKTIQPIRDGSTFVKPGSIHHLCLFDLPSKNGKPVRDAVFVSMLEAAQRVKQGKDLIVRTHPTRPDARFLMSLSQGEMVLAHFKGREVLVRLLTAASTSHQMWFALHTDARKSADIEKFSAKPNTLTCKKVVVDILGRLRTAND